MTEKNRDYAFSRKEYKNRELDRKDLLANPIEQFETWLKEALQSNEPEPTAMALATVSERGEPSARTVLLKEIDEEGFVFYTNYDSRKGKEIEGNPRGALVFFWPGMERQVRVEGLINKTSERKSDAYFSSRPGNSRRGAWASPQSQAISNRRYLEGLFAGVAKEKLKERPPFWGGYLLVPSKVEFWQGRPNRLNDRFLYKKVDDGWEITRLAP
jgi:pyridoxamine 5'-phosphate oxidase